ncbi:hypothetical protein HK105_206471 [Polyrhizophydium stewartii]|uniref:Uncharacterized protein n=1 Tax=Polyrhizophydium stewartii TaxID=2732419 RepID=A0ABR4N3G0_9FUNG
MRCLGRAAGPCAALTLLLFGSAWDAHVLPWFAARGVSCVAASLVGAEQALLSGESDASMDRAGDAYVQELARIAGPKSMFMPVIVAHAMHGLTVQRFLESHPCRGVVLVHPWSAHNALEALDSEADAQKILVHGLHGHATHARTHLSEQQMRVVRSALIDFGAKPSLFEGASATHFPMLVTGFQQQPSDPLASMSDMVELQTRYECDLELVDADASDCKHSLFMLDKHLAIRMSERLLGWMDEYGL